MRNKNEELAKLITQLDLEDVIKILEKSIIIKKENKVDKLVKELEKKIDTITKVTPIAI